MIGSQQPNAGAFPTGWSPSGGDAYEFVVYCANSKNTFGKPVLFRFCSPATTHASWRLSLPTPKKSYVLVQYASYPKIESVSGATPGVHFAGSSEYQMPPGSGVPMFSPTSK